MDDTRAGLETGLRWASGTLRSGPGASKGRTDAHPAQFFTLLSLDGTALGESTT